MRNSACLALLLAVPAASAPRVAVVIDDFGLTYPSNPRDEEWMRFEQPLTFAVMPESPRTKAAAQATLEAGKELIVHYPFDPFQSLALPKDSASREDVRSVSALLEKSLKQIPGAVGLNNHRSDRATRNRPLMKAFMSLYKAKGLYFLDSKVNPKSVAYEEARAAGLRAAQNFIFIDSAQVHTRAFCEKMLAQAVDRARKTGEAVTIGHHYFRGTLDCLKAEMPRHAAAGVKFVKLSALVR